MPADTTSEAIAAEAAPVGPRPLEELMREIIELEKQFPEPQRGGEIPDARWYQENVRELYKQYPGEHVAILNGAVAGHNWDELQLRIDVSRKYNVHPYSFFVAQLFTHFGSAFF